MYIFSLDLKPEMKFEITPEDFMARGVFKLKLEKNKPIALYTDAKLFCSEAGCVKANKYLYQLIASTYDPVTAMINKIQ